MEVTPLEHRGVSASSGEGVKPHGRDTSLSDTAKKTKESAAKAFADVAKTSAEQTAAAEASRQLQAKVEPSSEDVDRMASALTRVLPHLEEEAAKRIATAVLRQMNPSPLETLRDSTRGMNLDVTA